MHEELIERNRAIREMLAAGPEQVLLAIPGVIHVSVGLKERAGRATDQLCIRVYVREKRPEEAIPLGERIPAEMGGVPTDVNVVATNIAFQSDNTRYRPIKGGIAITNRIIGLNDAGTRAAMEGGTLGCTALDNIDGAPVALGNWHVLYAHQARDGDKVYQPGPTSFSPVNLLDLPLRPTDNDDKIGVLRRGTITDKVDCAIAAIDVSSWCNCCGTKSTNEVVGLQAAGAGRDTIVGDMRAVSGVRVFKRGRATLETAGRVLDDDYPPFSIQKGATIYTFTGQIAVQHNNPATPFGDKGDSGSVLVTQDNKIVGLYFADGHNVPVGGTTHPHISFANHIADVFAALNIRIAYSAQVVTTAGDVLTDVPVESEERVPESYQALRARIESIPATAPLFPIVQRHAGEVARLVNHCRPVKVAWHRAGGPAALASLMAAVRDGHERLPPALPEALRRMHIVLAAHGSEALQRDLARLEAEAVIDACSGGADLDEAIARLGRAAAGAGSEGPARRVEQGA